MKKNYIKVAIILMFISGGIAVGHHYHVHYEQPEWEILKEPIVRTSGSTSTLKYK